MTNYWLRQKQDRKDYQYACDNGLLYEYTEYMVWRHHWRRYGQAPTRHELEQQTNDVLIALEAVERAYIQHG